MSIFSKLLVGAAALLAFPCSVLAAEPVRHVAIYVEPFYRRRQRPTPSRRSASASNTMLCLDRISARISWRARDLITAAPKLVTPMTLMVLAIRLYDVGLRDDAVFWFYAAKDRYIVMSEVLDVKTQMLAQADDAMRSFTTLAGPVINGYAFCDLAKQKALHAKAVDWVESNPYEVMFMARAPALPGDRAENSKRAIANAKDRAAKERAYFDDAKNAEAFYATRKRNEADAKFCWK